MNKTAEPDTETIDYRPLPPRRAGEEPRPIAGESRRARGLNGWLLLATALLAIGALTGWLVWKGTRVVTEAPPQAMPLFASTILAEIPDAATRDQILSLDATAAQARAAVAQTPKDPGAWVVLGNAHYDFIQTIYEAAPGGEAYPQNLSRWLEASDAYSQSLALDPFQPVVRSDRGLALIRYGLGFGSPAYVAEGLAEAERALSEDDQTLQVLVNVGRAYALASPPRTAEARALWQRIIELAPNSLQAGQAQRLLNGEQQP
jgi:tetratricopeptide (TPR) repeat protein